MGKKHRSRIFFFDGQAIALTCFGEYSDSLDRMFPVSASGQSRDGSSGPSSQGGTKTPVTGETKHIGAWANPLPVQNFPHLLCKSGRREGLLQEGDFGFKDAVPNHGIIRVARQEQHF